MDYEQSLQWLFTQLPMYQRVGASAYKANLDNIKVFCDYLGNPQNKFKSIHIAGTNGKGSVAHFLSSILQDAGYKVGLHTSPHLMDFRERIKVNGRMINRDAVLAFVEQHKDILSDISPSFFEWQVAMAFDYFEKEDVDIAIVECGMGGRLDSTNIITPLISVITNIGIDHSAFLGSSIAGIATEKAGIIKKDVPVVIGEYDSESWVVFQDAAKRCNTTIRCAETSSKLPVKISGLPKYQDKNIRTVCCALQALPPELRTTEENIIRGIDDVVSNTAFHGRFEQVSTEPLCICDGAHNPSGLKQVLDELQRIEFKQLHIIFGMVNDKDHDAILSMLPANAIYYFTTPDVPRGLDGILLAKKASAFNLKGPVFKTVSKAYEKALSLAGHDDLIFIGGSFFVVADLLKYLHQGTE